MTDIDIQTGAAADKMIRVPAGIMSLLRQSYDTREKMLDWILAGAVVATMAYVFRDQLTAMMSHADDVNAGRADSPQPNQNVADAFPKQHAPADPYTYNMPVSRSIRYSIGPAATRPPDNPALQPEYP